MAARPLDHLVLPVTDIATSRRRMSALGFTVAADARHPFGTENACVFFADGTYLEPLGIASEAECQASAAAGNQFTARDAAFRRRNGPEGLAAIAMGTTDAEADHRGFVEAGLSGGDILDFSRILKLPDGTQITPSFRLSFASDPASPDFYGFSCQRFNMPKTDRSALERHANGATGILTVLLAASEPEDGADLLSAVIGGPAGSSDDEGVDYSSANATIRVLNPDGLQAFDGRDIDPAACGLRGVGVIFRVADLGAAERLLAENAIVHQRIGASLLIPAAPGQGVPFVFFAE